VAAGGMEDGGNVVAVGQGGEGVAAGRMEDGGNVVAVGQGEREWRQVARRRKECSVSL
jgi:hypothetical protein